MAGRCELRHVGDGSGVEGSRRWRRRRWRWRRCDLAASARCIASGCLLLGRGRRPFGGRRPLLRRRPPLLRPPLLLLRPPLSRLHRRHGTGRGGVQCKRSLRGADGRRRRGIRLRMPGRPLACNRGAVEQQQRRVGRVTGAAEGGDAIHEAPVREERLAPTKVALAELVEHASEPSKGEGARGDGFAQAGCAPRVAAPPLGAAPSFGAAPPLGARTADANGPRGVTRRDEQGPPVGGPCETKAANRTVRVGRQALAKGH